MSLLHVKTTKTMAVNGVKYSADIEKDVMIDFSAANYKVKTLEGTHDTKIELIPDRSEILNELTAIFPLSDYDINIMQNIYGDKHANHHVSICLNILDKDTGRSVYLPNSVALSDEDYDYIRNILVKAVPTIMWDTAESYLRKSIEMCMEEDNDNLFTDNAWNCLSHMVSARYKECKTDGYVDFDDDGMKDIAREILEKALLDALEVTSCHVDTKEGKK